MWWIYALLSAVFAALTAILAKVGISGLNSDMATAIRTTVVLILAWSIALFKGELSSISGMTRTNWLFLVLSGLATGLSWIFYFKALQLGKVNQVAPLDKLSVALVIIFSAVFLKESLSVKQAIAVCLIVSGSLLLVL